MTYTEVANARYYCSRRNCGKASALYESRWKQNAILFSSGTNNFSILERRQTLCKVMSIILYFDANGSFAVEGCGPYTSKRFAEVIIPASR